MKFETLARRLAEKSQTPLLEEVLLGQAEVKDLPHHCMIWTGAKYGATPRKKPRMHRSKRDGLSLAVISDEIPYGIIRWQGRTIAVRRLLFQLINKPDYEFRMLSQCQVPLCVNPLHYTVEVVEPEPEVCLDMIFEGDEGWEISEVEEIVEILLTEHTPTSWDEVANNPLTEDIPHEILRQVLLEAGKEFLT